jgi:hypothetical protein
MYEFSKESLQRVDLELRKDLLLCSRRRTTAQRRSRDCAVAVIARSEMGVIEVFRIIDNICNSLFLWGSRWRWSSGGRSLWHFGEIAPRILTHFGLGRIASSYLDYLCRDINRIQYWSIQLWNESGM